jgi:hypothetical protein
VLRRPRIRDRHGFTFGLFLVGLGAFGYASGIGDDVRAVFLVGGVLRVAAAFLFRWEIASGARGPGTLASSGTGRLRATGWPPSKDPADYR